MIPTPPDPDPAETLISRRLLITLEYLLSLPALDLKATLDEASTQIAGGLRAEKVDVFLYDPRIDSLVALGTSHTPLGARQKALGLDRLPCANGGRSVQVFQTGQSYATGHAEADPEELRGLIEGLGVRSTLAIPLLVQGERRGVVEATSIEPDHFAPGDLEFLSAVAHWIGSITHRAELVEQLRREEAEQASRQAADDLITVLAHDMGNYLTPLSGRVQLIKRRAERDGDSRYQTDANALVHIVDRLQRLIADLLDAGRLEQGIFALVPFPLDLVALIQDTVAALGTEICPITVQAPPELPMIGDAARLRQALENLLSNAVKYSPEGVPVVVTVVEERRPDGPWAAIHVRDQGPGIEASLLPQIFDRFVAGNRSRGLGLGLYLAHGIATAHAGTLTVESALGQGTEFVLAVPAIASRLPRH
jgi:signal transduction histidine kinase